MKCDSRYIVIQTKISEATLPYQLIGPTFDPVCLGCLLKFKEKPEYCHLCNLPICSKNCEFLDQHLSQECKVFQQAKIPDLGKHE